MSNVTVNHDRSGFVLNNRRRRRGALVFCLFGALLAAGTAHAQRGGGPQTLNLRDADIEAFIDDVAMMTGRSFIVDPRVQGKVTVISHSPLAREAVFQVFLSTLRVHGYTATPTSAGVYRIVPIDSAAVDTGVVNGAGDDGDAFVTEVFRLRHAEAVQAMNMVKPIIHPDGRAIAGRDSDILIIVDYASNLPRVRKIIDDLDRDDSKLRTVPLKHVSARELARLLQELLEEQSGERSATALRVIAAESSNALILRGAEPAIDRVMPIIAELDRQTQAQGDIKVYPLRHALGEDLLPILEQVSRSIREQQAPAGEAGGARGEPQASIAVHRPTNSVVISAGPALQQALSRVIEKLDIRRPQVLVEAIIVEVSDTAARELGLQYVLGGTDGTIPFTVTNFSNSAPNILAATGALLDTDALDNGAGDGDAGNGTGAFEGLSAIALESLLGINGFAGGAGGVTDGGTLFGVILNALDQDSGSNVLSTPSLMTMDNESARILVGQEIPVTTGEVLGNDNANPFRTVERQDVGVELEVRPQISEGDAIRLFIKQEVSSLVGPVSATIQELITNQREIETTVVVDDGEIVVLGGLIEEDEQVLLDKVPLLGDIPGLGALFRSESRSKIKTNLMVFIRPTIARTRDDLRGLTDRKYDYIRREQILSNGGDVPSLDRIAEEVLTQPGDTPSENNGGGAAQ